METLLDVVGVLMIAYGVIVLLVGVLYGVVANLIGKDAGFGRTGRAGFTVAGLLIPLVWGGAWVVGGYLVTGINPS